MFLSNSLTLGGVRNTVLLDLSLFKIQISSRYTEVSHSLLQLDRQTSDPTDYTDTDTD